MKVKHRPLTAGDTCSVGASVDELAATVRERLENLKYRIEDMKYSFTDIGLFAKVYNFSVLLYQAAHKYSDLSRDLLVQCHGLLDLLEKLVEDDDVLVRSAFLEHHGVQYRGDLLDPDSAHSGTVSISPSAPSPKKLKEKLAALERRLEEMAREWADTGLFRPIHEFVEEKLREAESAEGEARRSKLLQCAAAITLLESLLKDPDMDMRAHVLAKLGGFH